jgi:xanthine dehydrogenase accessory factor
LAIDFSALETMASWHAAGVPSVLVTVAAVRGSAPREQGAAMAVSHSRIAGTIGGGRLEWDAIERARAILQGEAEPGFADIALGPQIGQCCGGNVRLEFRPLDAGRLLALRAEAGRERDFLPQVFVFGAGHTGKAIAAALAPLPVEARLIDTRPQAFEGYDCPIAAVVTALPEAQIGKARPGAAHVVLTHDHGLDFLIAATALASGDAAYVGMIGSATKRAVFSSFLKDHGHGAELAARLVCPIGGSAVRDKRPQVIAALTVAEILTALAAYSDAMVQGSG